MAHAADEADTTTLKPAVHQPTLEKLASLRLREYSVDGLPLSEVLKMLTFDSKKSDPEKLGIRFESASPPAGVKPAVHLDRVIVRGSERFLRNVSLLDALDLIVKTSEQPIRFDVELNRVVFQARELGQPAITPRVARAAPGADLRTKAVQLVFPEVAYDGLPLPEVLKLLTADTRKIDPAGLGVNFISTSFFPDPPKDLKPGPRQGAPRRPDLDIVLIRAGGQVHRNFNLIQVLDLIINTASEPITYRFEDYGVVLTPVYPSKSATAPK